MILGTLRLRERNIGMKQLLNGVAFAAALRDRRAGLGTEPEWRKRHGDARSKPRRGWRPDTL